MADHHHADTSLLTRAESKERMLRAWRRAALVAALTGSTAIAAQLAGVVPAQAATPTITIAATSSNPRVTGDVWVIYLGGKYSRARIHGTITGATNGEVATLYAQRFPYARAAKPVRSITLSATGPTTAYSFTVAPSLATRYQVKVFAHKGATTPLATSHRQNLYVVTGGYTTGGNNCPGAVCRETYHMYSILPSSALRVEMSKHFDPYFGLNLSATGTPPYPTWLYLNAGNPRVSPRTGSPPASSKRRSRSRSRPAMTEQPGTGTGAGRTQCPATASACPVPTAAAPTGSGRTSAISASCRTRSERGSTRRGQRKPDPATRGPAKP